MLISLTVGKVDAGVAVLLTQDKRLIEFPSILLPPNISSGSIVDITVARNLNSESASQSAFQSLQHQIYHSFGAAEPSGPILRCRNATQTSVVLEWDPIEVVTADIISLSLFRNGQKAGNIPRPNIMQSTKISGLAVDTEYVFHLLLRTTAGTYPSEKVTVRTHKMTDLSGITVTHGILPAQLRDSLTNAIERIGAKLADTVRIDTTHFVTTEGRGSAWEKAVDMNIPVVRPEWVEGCERGGRIVGVRQYYLDADPRQRQVISQSERRLEEQPVKQPPTSPEKPNGNSTNGHGERPPTPPPKDEDESKADGDEESAGEEESMEAPDERKPSVEDSDQRNLAYRPANASPDTESGPAPVGLGLKDMPIDSPRSGESTPGRATFQDVAL